jgi:hypothetical protein
MLTDIFVWLCKTTTLFWLSRWKTSLDVFKHILYIFSAQITMSKCTNRHLFQYRRLKNVHKETKFTGWKNNVLNSLLKHSFVFLLTQFLGCNHSQENVKTKTWRPPTWRRWYQRHATEECNDDHRRYSIYRTINFSLPRTIRVKIQCTACVIS